MRKFEDLEGRFGQLERDVRSAEHQLADYSGFAAELNTRLNEASDQIDRLDDAVCGLAARRLEDYLDSVRYGLVEIGGFVRYSLLSRDQR